MKDTLKPLVDMLIKLIQNGANFVTGQIPDVARQILAFKKAEAILNIVLWFVVGVLVFWALSFLPAIKDGHDFTPQLTVRATLGGVGLWLFLLGGVPNAYTSSMTLLQIHYSPKLFLLEFLKGLLK